jgi:hypothetical protein
VSELEGRLDEEYSESSYDGCADGSVDGDDDGDDDCDDEDAGDDACDDDSGDDDADDDGFDSLYRAEVNQLIERALLQHVRDLKLARKITGEIYEYFKKWLNVESRRSMPGFIDISDVVVLVRCVSGASHGGHDDSHDLRRLLQKFQTAGNVRAHCIFTGHPCDLPHDIFQLCSTATFTRSDNDVATALEVAMVKRCRFYMTEEIFSDALKSLEPLGPRSAEIATWFKDVYVQMLRVDDAMNLDETTINFNIGSLYVGITQVLLENGLGVRQSVSTSRREDREGRSGRDVAGITAQLSNDLVMWTSRMRARLPEGYRILKRCVLTRRGERSRSPRRNRHESSWR